MRTKPRSKPKQVPVAVASARSVEDIIMDELHKHEEAKFSVATKRLQECRETMRLREPLDTTIEIWRVKEDAIRSMAAMDTIRTIRYLRERFGQGY